jgi:hypothetical protein
MEIPGFSTLFAILLIGSLIVFLILPRVGASVLVGLSVLLLVFCVYNHYTLFSSEYKLSTWQETLKWYAPVIMYGGLTVAILMYLGYLFSNKGSSMLPASNLSESTTNAIVNQTTSIANTISNTLGMNNNRVAKGNNSILGNLGGILNSPKRNNAI